MALAGAFIGLGAWFRMDSLLLSPVILVLRWQQSTPQQALLATTMAAAVSVMVLMVALGAVRLPLLAAWTDSFRRSNVASWQMLRTNGWLMLGFVPTLLCAAGTLRLLFRRAAGAIDAHPRRHTASLAVYGASFTTPKYLYYATPFLLLPALSGLSDIVQAPVYAVRRLGAVLILLVAVESALGVQTSSVEFRRFDPPPSPPHVVAHASRATMASSPGRSVSSRQATCPPRSPRRKDRAGAWKSP